MIPLSVPHLAGNEWRYVKDCLDTGWISSAGAYVGRFEEALAAFTGAPHAVACMNGTAALHIALHLSGVGPGDYVLVPNLTFVASLNAVKYTFAEPILVDVDPHTWQMDMVLLREFLETETHVGENGCRLKADGRRIGAIMPVHVLGNMAEIRQCMELAAQFGIPVVEDATEALGSYYEGRHAGTFGTFGCFSFNGNKIISTGGGGMIITSDPALAQKAKHLTTTAKVSQEEYFHDEVGYNYRLVNVLAAIGLAQMEQLPQFIERKKQIDMYYRRELEGVGDISFQRIPTEVDPNCWLFTLRTEKMRGLLAFLNEQEIQSRPFWIPMNRLPMYAACRYVSAADQANAVYESSLSIPCSSGLTDAQLLEVTSAIKAFFNRP